MPRLRVDKAAYGSPCHPEEGFSPTRDLLESHPNELVASASFLRSDYLDSQLLATLGLISVDKVRRRHPLLSFRLKFQDLQRCISPSPDEQAAINQADSSRWNQVRAGRQGSRRNYRQRFPAKRGEGARPRLKS